MQDRQDEQKGFGESLGESPVTAINCHWLAESDLIEELRGSEIEGSEDKVASSVEGA